MSAAIQIQPPPLLSEEVRAFAAEKGVSGYLPALAEATRCAFPDKRIKVEIVPDPELSYNTTIVFDVDATGMDDVEELLQAYHIWDSELCRICPSTHVHVFGILLLPWA